MAILDTLAGGIVTLFDFVQHRMPPGPPFLPMNWIINTQKSGCWIFLLCLMYYYDNWSTGAWIYLFLHGSYGITWFIKDLVFPDASFQQKTSFSSAILLIFLLAMYLLPGYQMMSGIAENEPSLDRIIASSLAYIIGQVLMTGSDCQKYYTLKYKKGLICTGFFGKTRNPNYLGEMLIYGSFAMIGARWEFWYVLVFVWSALFLPRMIVKDISLRKKEGWNTYDSYLLFPKFSSSHIDNLIIYGLITTVGLAMYASGGFLYFYIELEYIYKTHDLTRMAGLIGQVELLKFVF